MAEMICGYPPRGRVGTVVNPSNWVWIDRGQLYMFTTTII